MMLKILRFLNYFNANYSELAQRLNAGSALSDEDKKTLIEGLNSFKSTF